MYYRYYYLKCKIQMLITVAALLCAFAADSSRELNVFRHNCDAFRMNGAQVCVLKQSH